MIVLRPQASIEEINTVVYQALKDPAELQRKAMAGFAYAREWLTNTRKVDRMLSDVRAYRRVSLAEQFRWSEADLHFRQGERGYSVRLEIAAQASQADHAYCSSLIPSHSHVANTGSLPFLGAQARGTTCRLSRRLRSLAHRGCQHAAGR